MKKRRACGIIEVWRRITVPDVRVGDRVQMRKKHPCGSDEWVIYRIGADIGMRCAGCDRRVLLARREFDRRLRRILSTTQGEERD